VVTLDSNPLAYFLAANLIILRQFFPYSFKLPIAVPLFAIAKISPDDLLADLMHNSLHSLHFLFVAFYLFPKHFHLNSVLFVGFKQFKTLASEVVQLIIQLPYLSIGVFLLDFCVQLFNRLL
jgi:hypothetical protein